ncbi:MAG: NAD(P)/FAD-dependent oxidoreductase [Gemmatimonadota bacterium]|nr:NAD(P)/FAD-dependent oxidoreductase [Gemmatimonadota bacterium]
MDTGVHDIAIVGGGPAGLSAGIWLARYLHSVVLVDSGDPRNWATRSVNGFLGLPRIRPPQLRELGRAECRRYGVTLVDEIVDRVHQPEEEHFILDLQSGARYESRRLLLAIGLRDRWPDIPGLDHVFGANAHVCPDCDGYECLGKKTVVVGTGRKAVGLALNLTTWTHNIIICTNGEPPGFDRDEYCGKLDALNIPVITERVTCLTTVDRSREIYSLELANGMCLDVDKLFFTFGQHAADDLGAQLGCERDEDGQIIIDGHYRTSVLNVFAAGDIVPGPQLAIAAASDGAMAALAIHKSLVPEERKLTSV